MKHVKRLAIVLLIAAAVWPSGQGGNLASAGMVAVQAIDRHAVRDMFELTGGDWATAAIDEMQIRLNWYQWSKTQDRTSGAWQSLRDTKEDLSSDVDYLDLMYESALEALNDPTIDDDDPLTWPTIMLGLQHHHHELTKPGGTQDKLDLMRNVIGLPEPSVPISPFTETFPPGFLLQD